MTTSLFEKYNIPSGYSTNPLSTLSFILRKAELGKRLSKSEWQWLNSQNLPEASQLIVSQENYRESLELEIKRELRELRLNKFIYASFKFPTIPAIDSDDAFVFYKVGNLEDLSEDEAACNYLFLQILQQLAIMIKITILIIMEQIQWSECLQPKLKLILAPYSIWRSATR